MKDAHCGLVAGAALDELVDAAVLERNQTGRARQVALHDPHLRLFFGIPFVAEIDPEQLGLIHAPRRKEADRQANSSVN